MVTTASANATQNVAADKNASASVAAKAAANADNSSSTRAQASAAKNGNASAAASSAATADSSSNASGAAAGNADGQKGELAFTGSDVLPVVAPLAGLLVLLGGAVLFIAKRRKATDKATDKA
ncbi:MAG: LPXTG cell wall anchor domain-containing protein [Patulibacter sp.]|nr:LPXTG cell wall anchor domain-containing protein [Patulibacter sp.]